MLWKRKLTTLICCFRSNLIKLQLKSKFQSILIITTLKKYIEYNIYALVLSIPGELEFYLQKDQSFNFLELEHYFDIHILKSNNVVEETPIPKIFRIKDGKKKEFSKYIRNQSDPGEARLIDHIKPVRL